MLRYDLPHGHNDFIFALIGHQWGLVGASLLIVLYILLIIGGIEIAANQPEPFGRLIAVGVCTLFAAQMFINIGMTMGLMPITGMTLPFVSYGRLVTGLKLPGPGTPNQRSPPPALQRLPPTL